MADPIPVRTAYDEWAATYDGDENATRDLDALVLRSAPLPLDGAAVIEFGTGTGKNTAYLAARARRVLGLDLSPAMLDRARSRRLGDHVALIEHDVTRPWPAPDGEADVVVGNLVLEHVADLEPVFVEAHRVLRPGGLLCVCELHPYRQLRGSTARFAREAGEARVEACIHTTAEYVGAALSAGFELILMAEPTDPDPAPGGGPPALPRLLQLILKRR